MEYVVEFVKDESGYKNTNVIMSCWSFYREGDDIKPVIDEAIAYAKSKGYVYFYIHDGNINHVLYEWELNK